MQRRATGLRRAGDKAEASLAEDVLQRTGLSDFDFVFDDCGLSCMHRVPDLRLCRSGPFRMLQDGAAARLSRKYVNSEASE